MKSLLRIEIMDSDSDSPFNYSWPSFPKMRMRRKMGKKGNLKRYPESCESPILFILILHNLRLTVLFCSFESLWWISNSQML